MAAGIRRIEAVTGEEGIRYIHGKDDVLNEVLSILKTTPKDLVWRMNKLIQTQKQIEKELERLKTEGGRTAIDSNDR